MLHGHLPEREILTEVGPVAVKVPRVRDRKPGEAKITFAPSILPRYLRKAKSVEELLPWLYLKGSSTGDFCDALAALLGPEAKGLSAKTVTRLKVDWWSEYEAWETRDLGTRRFLYIWAHGVYFKPRMAEEKQCVLVIVGADEYGRKALLTFYDYPAGHWKHIRTSNPIESTFATVRHRTTRTKGCLSRKTGLAMAFRRMMSAQTKWRKLDGRNRMPEVINGGEFRAGVRHIQAAA
ncbi:hypothetical protein BFP70_17450 [Thioclava sp. SK-1]|nr:hypothetical protein BFP70_17450 [Thioclava sp. SK-1]